MIERRYLFKLVEKDEEYRSLQHFRQIIYTGKQNYILNEPDRFDTYSYNFILKDATTLDLVASCRLTPYKNGEFEATSMFQEVVSELDPANYIQLNRVNVKKDYRNNYLHAVLFWEITKWVQQNLPHQKFFSLCELNLVRFYKEFGVETLGEPKKIEKRNNKTYVIIAGDVATVASLMYQKFTKIKL